MYWENYRNMYWENIDEPGCSLRLLLMSVMKFIVLRRVDAWNLTGYLGR